LGQCSIAPGDWRRREKGGCAVGARRWGRAVFVMEGGSRSL
jgi:hypothetical protein